LVSANAAAEVLFGVIDVVCIGFYEIQR